MKERMHDLDVLKGIGIIMVVFGHAIPRGAVWNLIYACHMPLFIFCSGLLTGQTLKWIRLAKIMISYILMAVFCTGVYYCIFESGNIIYIKQTIYNVLVGGFSPSHGIYPVEALWFLPCLCLTTLLFYLIKLIPHQLTRHLTVILGTAAGVFLTNNRDQIPMYYNLDISLLVLPFFYIACYYGACLRQKMIELGKLLRMVSLGVLAAYVICAMLNGEVNIFRGMYGRSVFLYYISGFLGIAWLWSVSALLANRNGVAKCILQKVGRHTLLIMGTHQLLLVFLRQKCGIEGGYVLLLLTPLVIAVTFGISCLIAYMSKLTSRRKKND
jgi:fucose 4-O-acetylase-like acetyltransferase